MTESEQPTAEQTKIEMTILSLDGKDYRVEDLPPDIQNMLAIYTTWTEELKVARVEVYKLEAATRGITSEIQLRIKQARWG